MRTYRVGCWGWRRNDIENIADVYELIEVRADERQDAMDKARGLFREGRPFRHTEHQIMEGIDPNEVK